MIQEQRTIEQDNQYCVRLAVHLDAIRFPRAGQSSGSWTIASFFVDKVIEGVIPLGSSHDLIWAVGEMPKLNHTDNYIIVGNFIKDPKWGWQCKVEMMRLNFDLTDIEDQKTFLRAFLTPTQIDALYKTFPDPIQVLEQEDVESLLQVKGIGPVTAQKLCRRYADNKDNGIAYVALKDYDLTKNAIDKLVTRYGSPDTVVSKVLENPYILITEVWGYGWAKADKIALSHGLAPNAPERVRAYILYYLNEQAESNGNSWVSIDDLLSCTQVICDPISDEDLFQITRELLISDSPEVDPILYYDHDTRRIGLTRYYKLEKDIAAELCRLQTSEIGRPISSTLADVIIHDTELKQGFDYTEEQKQAIYMALNNQVSILTGKAGCGKTHSVSAIAAVLEAHGYKVAQTSLSGRAASKLTEVTHLEGKTIHRLLGYNPLTDSFAYGKDHPLPFDCIIGDEVSMWGGAITLQLLEAIKSGAKFIMVGDPAQLEAIGLANVFADAIKSHTLPVSILTKIMRQQGQSGIISQSLKVSNGEQIVLAGKTGSEIRGELCDFKLDTFSAIELTAPTIIAEFKKLYFEQRVDAKDIQVIVPLRARGESSCRALNIEIQKIVNGIPTPEDISISYIDSGVPFSYTFRPNDRIIVTKNNYKTYNVRGQHEPIFNGNVGYIKSIDEDCMIIDLSEQGEILLDKADWDDLSLGYAITVHKKQGDSSPYIIFGLDNMAYALLSRELVYTGITRARKFCVVVAQTGALRRAVAMSKVRIKQTWLQEMLKNNFLQGADGHNV